MAVTDQISAEIIEKLQRAFAPERLEVVNESHLHAGHSGDDGSGATHFRVQIRAAELAGLGRLARHRAVLAALGDLPRRIHALALDIG